MNVQRAARAWMLVAWVGAAGCGRAELEVTLPCYAPVADCNGRASDGCEVNLLSDIAHCGGCGIRCEDGLACGDGRCVPPDTPVDVETNGLADLVRTAGGRVLGWGLNDTGILLSDEDRALVAAQLDVPALAELRMSHDMACGRTQDGRVWCWGDGPVPGRSAEVAPSPAVVPGLFNVVRLTSWFYGHCALEAKGQWTCWDSGADSFRVLAIGSGADVTYPLEQPVHMDGLPGFGRDVLTGAAVLADGSVWAWGYPRMAGQPDFVEAGIVNVVDPAAELPFAMDIGALYGWREQMCGTSIAALGIAAPGGPAPGMAEQGVVCWGAEVTDPADPEGDGHFEALPPAGYKRVTPSYLHLCGLRDDAQIVCPNTVYDIERGAMGDIASVDREFLAVDLEGRVYCLDIQEEGNCATGETGFVYDLVEVPLPL